MDNCCICGQIAGDPAHDLLHHARGAAEYERWVPLETDHFAVIPSIGALVPGHVLLCPRRHVRSSALLDANEAHEMERASAALEGRLRSEFGGAVQLFEHGNSAGGTHIGCSVEHAHLHFIPGAPEIWDRIADDLAWVETDESIARLARGGEYIRYRTGEERWYVCLSDADGDLPSQYLRRRFAEALGLAGEWNWREAPRFEVTRETMERLATAPAALPS